MKRLTVAIVILVLGVAAADSASATIPVVFGGDVAGLFRARPSSIHITSDQNIERIRWNSWGGRTATGRGTLVFSASDGLPPAHVSLTLSTIRRCGPRRQYLWLHVAARVGQHDRFDLRYTCRSPF